MIQAHMEDLADTMHGDASDFLQMHGDASHGNCWQFFLAPIKDDVYYT